MLDISQLGFARHCGQRPLERSPSAVTSSKLPAVLWLRENATCSGVAPDPGQSFPPWATIDRTTAPGEAPMAICTNAQCWKGLVPRRP